MEKIKAELEIINGKPTWCIDRQSFEAWAAKRNARTANVVGGALEAEAAHE